jgi:hypothetical protein
MAYLHALPSDQVRNTLLLATGPVVKAARESGVVGEAHIIAGRSSLGSARRVLSSPGLRIVVVIAPDPWGPFKGKGFVRARLLAPWALAPVAHVDLMELRSGGEVRRTSRGLARAALLRKIYLRETLLLTEYVVWAGTARPQLFLESRTGRICTVLRAVAHLPRAIARASVGFCMALVTLARVIPFISLNETRARLRVRH